MKAVTKNLVPPQAGDESFESFMSERDGILSSLARRAKVCATPVLPLLRLIDCTGLKV
jgi:hypothetical protein